MREQILNNQRVRITPDQLASKIATEVVEMIVFFASSFGFVDAGTDEGGVPSLAEIDNRKW